MYDLNECIRSLNVGLPDDIARLKAAGYYPHNSHLLYSAQSLP